MKWYGEFFLSGHSIEYIDNLNYWLFLSLTDAISESRQEEIPSTSGKTKYKKLKPSQKKMIDARIEQRKKEGIKIDK